MARFLKLKTCTINLDAIAYFEYDATNDVTTVWFIGDASEESGIIFKVNLNTVLNNMRLEDE